MPNTYIDASPVAASVPFDNSVNGFIAENVQTAIEESKNTASTTEVVATADTTTTSTTDVLINSMTITPVAGDYLVWFSTCVDHSAQSVAVVVSLYVGGSLIVDSVRAPVPRFNALGAQSLNPCVAINGKITANGAQAIEVRWKTASGTATAHQRNLMIVRVA